MMPEIQREFKGSWTDIAIFKSFYIEYLANINFLGYGRSYYLPKCVSKNL